VTQGISEVLETSPPDPAFKAARDALAHAAPPRAGRWLVVTLILYVLTQLGDTGVASNLVTLVGVLLFHEAGHYVAMRAFGYRDVRMFFIPFFGAAVTARPRGVAAWKQAVVMLAGPLPGIVLGCALAIVMRQPWSQRVALVLFVVNGANLLPLAGLDGGRFARCVLFSRQRYMELAFLAITGAILLLLALRLKLWFLGVFAYFGLVALPSRNRILRAAHELRPSLAGETDATSLPYDRAWPVFDAARRTVGERAQGNPQRVASVMDALLEAAQPPPSGGISALLGGVWLLGLLATDLGLTIPFIGAAPKYWHNQRTADGGFIFSMPYSPKAVEPFSIPGWTGRTGLASGTTHKYELMEWSRAPDSTPSEGRDDAGLERAWVIARAALAPTSSEAGHAVTFADIPGREAELPSDKRVCKLRVLADNDHLVALSACAPGSEPETDRFLDSLRHAKAP